MSDLKSRVREWILQANPKVDGSTLTEDTPLLENKILSSIQLMDLILFLEHVQGQPVDIDQVKPENFYSLNTICTAFAVEAN